MMTSGEGRTAAALGPSGFLDPSGVHVGDTFDGDVLTNERIIAYGFYTDDLQAVITLMPRHLQAISSDRPTHNGPGPGSDDWLKNPSSYEPGGTRYSPGHPNYCTFFLDEQGNRSFVQWHTNIVVAVERYTQEMGMDV